jgi:hypothetical protein
MCEDRDYVRDEAHHSAVFSGWTIGVLGFDFRWKLGIVLFTTTSRTALEPRKPPTQSVTGAFSLGVKRPGR